MPTESPSLLKTSLVLGGFCLVAAVVLAVVNLATVDRIREQQLAAERRALAEVFPAHHHDNDLLAHTATLDPGVSGFAAWSLIDTLQLTGARQAYIATRDGDFAGAILPVVAHDGYSGDILLLVGILADGTVTGVRVLEHRETPGLGDKIDAGLSDWIYQFDGRTVARSGPPWRIVRDGGDIDQLTGATITSRAVVNAAHRASRFFINNRTQLAGNNAD